jgi:hypothetical protein
MRSALHSIDRVLRPLTDGAIARVGMSPSRSRSSGRGMLAGQRRRPSSGGILTRSPAPCGSHPTAWPDFTSCSMRTLRRDGASPLPSGINYSGTCVQCLRLSRFPVGFSPPCKMPCRKATVTESASVKQRSIASTIFASLPVPSAVGLNASANWSPWVILLAGALAMPANKAWAECGLCRASRQWSGAPCFPPPSNRRS